MGYTVTEGNYEKLGVQASGGAVTFSFAGEKEENCAVLLYDKNRSKTERVEVPREYCMGSVRSVCIHGLSPKNLNYNYEIDGKVVSDPYATRVIGREKWNDAAREEYNYEVSCGYEDMSFDWQGDRQPEVPRNQMIMYKLHVRGFSMDAGIRGRKRGTFAAVKEQIPYLKSLGITTVEFMPIYEFEEIVIPEEPKMPEYLRWQPKEEDTIKPESAGKPERVNCWGYIRGSYFAVKASYSSTTSAACEWKELIRTLHENGMECVMEMFFDTRVNHNEILDALRFWVKEYHVDGFHLIGDSLPVTAVAQDALLSRTKIFCSGFAPMLLEQKRVYPHLFLYTDEYLYPVRKMLNHMDGNLEEFACQQRKQHPVQGFVNYIAGNNGFTLADVFSYQEKHNKDNGEDNRDGNVWNYSSNCGVEGKTSRRYVREQRERQLRNAIAILMLGQGVPLLLAGDEAGNSQEGNNNAYCQDNRIGWVNWKKAEKYTWLQDYTRDMIALRKSHPILAHEEPMRLNDYLRKGVPDLSYHGENAWMSFFFREEQKLGTMYCGSYATKEDGSEDDFVYVGYNFHNGSVELALPKLPDEKMWYLVLDTARGKEAFLAEEEAVSGRRLSMSRQSVAVLVGK